MMSVESPDSGHDSDRKLLGEIDRIGRAIVISILILAGFVIWYFSSSFSSKERPDFALPPLIAAPTIAEQIALIAAIKSHPNPPIKTDWLPPLGSDAKGLKTLLFALSKSGEAQGTTAYTCYVADDRSRMESTYLLIEIGGDPPRVIRRRVETYYDP